MKVRPIAVTGTLLIVGFPTAVFDPLSCPTTSFVCWSVKVIISPSERNTSVVSKPIRKSVQHETMNVS